MKITKTLCSLGRDEIKENMAKITEIVSHPKFICRKCARVSQKKKHLCKPVKIKSKA